MILFQGPLIARRVEPAPSTAECGDLTLPRPHLSTAVPPEVSALTAHWEELKVTPEEAEQLEKNTRDQAKSDQWHQARKCRLTSSNFGRIIKRKKDFNDHFFNSIFPEKTIRAAATSYGTAHEQIARQMYAKSNKVHVHKCGLVVHPDIPFLGASPDGKVCDKKVTGILEIKCPYSIRGETIDQALNGEKARTLFLEKTDTGVRLKRNHDYWFQVQGQLLVTGAPFCDFVTYTSQDIHVERIVPHHETMKSMMTKLADVYATHVREYLANKKPSE